MPVSAQASGLAGACRRLTRRDFFHMVFHAAVQILAILVQLESYAFYMDDELPRCNNPFSYL